jgi:2-polyprenyl-6-methoxyphenol hydroxylase-like FAD-dependent oxidoreductase
VIEVLIAGGGIGGLATALALRRKGAEVLVVERERELRDAGAGLTLWPNAIHALRRLDLGSDLDRAAVPLRASRTYWRDGRPLLTTPMDGYSDRYGAPAVGIHRADLLTLLGAALDGERLRVGTRVRRFEERDSRVVAIAEGRELEGDVLVGADGVHSAVRTGLLGSQPPRHSGCFAWRGVTAAPVPSVEPNTLGLMIGKGTHFGWLPVARERFYWFGVGRTGDDLDALGRFGTWAAPVPDLIMATPAHEVLVNDLVDRPPQKPWGRGRVTLIGDAAHAMLPGLGQGACAALEDAVVLAEKLASIPDPIRALRAYERERMRRGRRLQSASRFAFDVLQWRNPVARALRSVLFKLPPRLLEQQQDWVFSYGRAERLDRRTAAPASSAPPRT